MVEHREVLYEECLRCEALGLCTMDDVHRKRDGYSKIRLGSEECKECKEAEYEICKHARNTLTPDFYCLAHHTREDGECPWNCEYYEEAE